MSPGLSSSESIDSDAEIDACLPVGRAAPSVPDLNVNVSPRPS